MKPCRYFAEGRCTRGDSCLFSHDVSGSTKERFFPPEISTAHGPAKVEKACEYYQRGICKYGENCKFRHDGILPSVNGADIRYSGEPAPQPRPDTRSQVSCKHYLLGRCAKGKDCSFDHSLKAEGGDLSSSEKGDEEQHIDEFRRELSGAFVLFEDGAKISKIELVWEYAAVRLNGLPNRSNRASVTSLLHGIGIEVPAERIRVWPTVEGVSASCMIYVESQPLAQALCSTLNASKASVQKYSEATYVARSTPSWSVTRRVSCNKVNISWHKRTRLVWLNFGTSLVAERVRSKFNRGTYQVIGQTVQADEPKHSPSRGYNRLAWTVVLKNVPIHATPDHISACISSDYDKPRHVEFQESRNDWDPETITGLVKSLFTNIGPVSFEMRTTLQGKREKAIAQFEEASDAREAVKLLNDKPLAFLNQGKLTVQLVSSSKFKIPSAVYQATKDLLHQETVYWRDRRISISFFNNAVSNAPFTTVKVEGEDEKLVANATHRIDGIVAGRTITDKDQPFWTPALASNRSMRVLRKVEQEFHVAIGRNKLRRQLTFFGPDDKFERVQSKVIERFNRESLSTFTIELDAVRFAWACRGGFHQVVDALGAGVASFDIISVPKRINVTGSQDQHDTAVSIVNRMEATLSSDGVKSADDCCICWTEPEDPVSTSCNHRYCSECMENLSLSAASTGQEFCIICQGDMGNCGKALPLNELREHLSSNALEDTLEASFQSYVKRHPEEFRYCPTPDCGYIYRVSAEAKVHSCPGCIQVVCTCCHYQHGAKTCAEHAYIRSGANEEFAKYKKAMGMKDCPRCSTAIEKTGGCNHMTCTGCGAHICWVCLEVFKVSGECYAHMTAVHGGAFDVNDLIY